MPQLMIPAGYREKKAAEQKAEDRRVMEIAREIEAEAAKIEAADKKDEHSFEKALDAFLTQDENRMNTVFDELKRTAGRRGFTFLGRVAGEGDTLADVLKRFPAGEIEEGGATIKAALDPSTIRAFGAGQGGGPIDPLMQLWYMLGEPFFRQPGGFLKFLRRKSQEYVDPEGETMTPRPSQTRTMFEPLAFISQLMSWAMLNIESDITRENLDLRMRREDLKRSAAYFNKNDPRHATVMGELRSIDVKLVTNTGEFERQAEEPRQKFRRVLGME